MNFQEIGKYSIKVKTIERYWAGDGSGKQTGAPGRFLEQDIIYLGIQGELDKTEELFREKVKKNIKLDQILKKEVTHEPEGYTELIHNHYVKNIEEKLPEKELREYLVGKLKDKL